MHGNISNPSSFTITSSFVSTVSSALWQLSQHFLMGIVTWPLPGRSHARKNLAFNRQAEDRRILQPTNTTTLPDGTSPYPATSAPITDQRTVSALRIGYARADHTACEVIAVYNALLLSARSTVSPSDASPSAASPSAPALSELIYQAENHGSLMLGGHFGTNPYHLGRLLTLGGLSFRTISSMSALQQPYAQNTLFILSVWNDARNPFCGVHTFLAQSDGAGGFYTYNELYAAAPLPPRQTTPLLRKARLITAYLIIPPA